jgi:hypothetical protein
MTRICILCERIIGEKCARCGREVAAPKTDSNGDAMTGTTFDCASCRHHFPQGDGGKTGGMCELCFDAALLRGHEQVTTSQKT